MLAKKIYKTYWHSSKYMHERTNNMIKQEIQQYFYMLLRLSFVKQK